MPPPTPPATTTGTTTAAPACRDTWQATAALNVRDKACTDGAVVTTLAVNTAFFDGLTEEQRTSFTETLDAVNAALTQEAIIPLISRVEFDKEDPEDVAAQFLTDAGITG